MEIYAQEGRSMIEMLGVLSIVGVLSVGGIAGYSKAMTQYKVNKTIEQITEMYANIKTLCRDRPCGSVGPMLSVVYPETLSGCTEFTSAGHSAYKNCTHALGGDFDAFEDVKYDGTRFFWFGIIGLKDRDACIKLATYNWNFDGLYHISIGEDSGFLTYDDCQTDIYTKNSENFVEGDPEYILKCDRITPAEAAYICSNCLDVGCGIWIAYNY